MGTDALITVKDKEHKFFIHQSMDGYPDRVTEFLKKALKFSWGKGRYEAPDYAAALVAVLKIESGAGCVFLANNKRDWLEDAEYQYLIKMTDDEISVKISTVRFGNKSRLFKGSIEDAITWAEAHNIKENEDET